MSAMLRSPACSPSLGWGAPARRPPTGRRDGQQGAGSHGDHCGIAWAVLHPAGNLSTFRGFQSARALKSGVQVDGAHGSILSTCWEPETIPGSGRDPHCRGAVSAPPTVSLAV